MLDSESHPCTESNGGARVQAASTLTFSASASRALIDTRYSLTLPQHNNKHDSNRFCRVA